MSTDTQPEDRKDPYAGSKPIANPEPNNGQGVKDEELDPTERPDPADKPDDSTSSPADTGADDLLPGEVDHTTPSTTQIPVKDGAEGDSPKDPTPLIDSSAGLEGEPDIAGEAVTPPAPDPQPAADAQ